MRLSGGHTLRAQQTVATMVTPFQAKTNFLTLRFFYPAALGAQKTARTASPSLGDVNIEGLDPKGTAQTGTIGTRLGWSHQFPALILGLLESCRCYVSSIYVEFARSLQATEFLISQGFIQTTIVAGYGLLSDYRSN